MDFKRYVQRTNKAFEAASPEEKRVTIAKDVIKRIKAENLVASGGKLIKSSSFSFKNYEDSFKDIINTAEECEVCAKGALLCSFVGRVNKFTVTNALGNINRVEDDIHQKLKELFDLKQLDLVECAFEGKTYLYEADIDERYKAFKYYKKYIHENERLIAICKNIIKNSGTFKP